MKLACAYLEGKNVIPVSATELLAAAGQGSMTLTPADASLRDTPPLEVAGQPSNMTVLTPEGALTAAHQGTRLPGSSTACVLRLNRATNCLSVANLVSCLLPFLVHGRCDAVCHWL